MRILAILAITLSPLTVAMGEVTCGSYLQIATNDNYHPGVFVERKAQRMLAELRREPRIDLESWRYLELLIQPKTKHFREFLYSSRLVKADEYSRLMSDKLFAATLFRQALGESFTSIHPPFAGLKAFLRSHGFVDGSGQFRGDRKSLRKALDQAFPQGFMLKPTVGWSSDAQGFFTREDEIIDLIMADKIPQYRHVDTSAPQGAAAFRYRVLSGEHWFFMGKISGSMLTTDVATGQRNEYRVHTFWDEVVPEATVGRHSLEVSPEGRIRAEQLIQKLLDLLPKSVLQRQAWSFDVLVTPDGQAQVVELNTNRGFQQNWSGFLTDPQVLAGYVNYLERRLKWSFQSDSGTLLRSGFGNFKHYVKLELTRLLAGLQSGELTPADVRAQLKELDDEYASAVRRAPPHVRQTASFPVISILAAEIEHQLTALETDLVSAWADFVRWCKVWIAE